MADRSQPPPPSPPSSSLRRRFMDRIAGWGIGRSVAPAITTPAPTATPSALPSTSLSATGSGAPYDAGSNGPRMSGFAPSRYGPTTSLWSTLDLMVARCRDERRNNPWAASACDNAESQWVGNGIKPHWNIPDLALKAEIERKFARWAKVNRFYAKQATAAREIFEAGEVFCRFYVRPSSWDLRVPLEIELIENEQVPVWLNSAYGAAYPGASTPDGNAIRTGIEFDSYYRIVAYHMYRAHPGETMFNPIEGLKFIRVPSSEIVHTFKPLRAGLLRGEPHLAAVLTLLHEIGKYSDATVVKKTIQTMFAGFIEKTDPGADILPIATTGGTGSPSNPPPPPPPPFGGQDALSIIKTGSMNEMLPGEKIVFPTLPQDNDLESVFRVWLHEFAAGCGSTYEQITGDLKGVNLSSIRAGIKDFQRKCEQFQRNIMVAEFAEPVVCRWIKEAVLCGELSLPGYASDPSVYEDIAWALPGWAWIDPVKDMQAAQMAVRSGFSSRERVCAEAGEDAAAIDAENKSDHEREDEVGVVYDTRPDKILLGRETNPEVPEEGEDTAQSDVAAPSNKPQPGQKTVKPRSSVGPKTAPKGKPNGKAATVDVEIVQ